MTADGGQESREAASERAKLLCLSRRHVDIDMSGQATLSSPYSEIRARCLNPPGPLQTSRGSGLAGQGWCWSTCAAEDPSTGFG
jgi:hypothetical protein